MMFFSSRIVPPTPPSLVKLIAAVCSLMSGPGISTPISDQVPELRYAQDEPLAGTAATAAAVSCAAGAMTCTGESPVSAATCVRKGPSAVPGCTMVPRIWVGSLKDWSRPYAQLLAVGSYIWVVLTSVNSLVLTPVNQ